MIRGKQQMDIKKQINLNKLKFQINPQEYSGQVEHSFNQNYQQLPKVIQCPHPNSRLIDKTFLYQLQQKIIKLPKLPNKNYKLYQLTPEQYQSTVYMQHQDSHASSARKKLLQFQQTIKWQESQNDHLRRTLSKQHSKLMESILRDQIQKQQSERAIKRQYSTKGYNSNRSNTNYKTPSSLQKKIDIQLTSLNTTFKPLKTSRSNRYEEIKIDTNDQQSSVNENNQTNHPQFYKDTDQIRSARQNGLMEVKKIKFQFQFLSYVVEVMLGYGIFIGVLYLIRLGSFPYFELIFIMGLMSTIKPWKVSNLIVGMCGIPITIVNNYLGLSGLTYLQILICYLGTMAFNQKWKVKIVFILVLVVQIVFGVFVFSNLYQVFSARKQIYYYIYPLFMFILRTLVQFGYWIVGYTEPLFLQITLFLIGLEYGTILSIPVGEIQFWYLIVFFTLQIINDRTHFILKVLVKITNFCLSQLRTTPGSQSIKNNQILPPHWNGFSSIHSFHLIGAVYILTQLSIFSSPYSSTLNLSIYLQNSQWYKPLIVWVLISVYEVMCILLLRKRQNVLLIGYTNNGWYAIIQRSILLVIGLWMFYIGLGVSAYSLQRLV